MSQYFDAFFSSPEYTQWAMGNIPWKLRVYGAPQCGKTTLATAVKARLHREDPPPLVLSIFLDPDDEIHGGDLLPADASSTSSLAHLLLAMLQQAKVDARFSQRQPASAWPDVPLADVWTNIRAMCEHRKNRFLILDSHDLCPVDLRPSLAEQLIELQKLGFAILVTSAEPVHSRLEVVCNDCEARGLRLFHRCSQCGSYDLCESCYAKGLSCERPGHVLSQICDEVEYDLLYDQLYLEEYVREELGRRMHESNNEYDSALRLQLQATGEIEHLSTEIATKAGRTFGIAKALLDYLRDFQMVGFEEITQVQTRVSLPEAEFFDGLIRRVQRQDECHRTIGLVSLDVLTQASFAAEKLKSQELAQAVQLLCPRVTADMLSTELEARLSHCCKGLIYRDRYSEIQHFHRTGDIYLRENCEDVFKEVKINGVRADLADICLERLSLVPADGQWSTGVEGQLQRLAESDPFTVFAARNWGDLFRNSRCYDEIDSPASQLKVDKALGLLRNRRQLTAVIYLANQRAGVTTMTLGWHAVHVCAWFGLDKLLKFFDAKELGKSDVVEGRTPIMVAITQGHLGVVKELLKAGADTTTEDIYGQSVLINATKAKHQELLDLLLSCSRSESNIGAARTTPLIAAIETQPPDPRFFKRLISSGHFDVNESTSNGQTALLVAVQQASQEDCFLLDHLLQHPKLNLAHRDFQGRTALHRATELGEPQIIEKILNCQNCTPAIVNSIDHVGMTPVRLLFESRLQNHPNELQPLLELFKAQGADLTYIDGHGKSLQYTAQRIKYDSDLLLAAEHDAADGREDVCDWSMQNIKCCLGPNLTMSSITAPSPQLIEPTDFAGGRSTLLEAESGSSQHQRSQNTGTSRTQSPATQSTPPELLSFDPETGETALHKAVNEKNLELCHEISQKFMHSRDIPSFDGTTPLMLAIENCENDGDDEYLEVLRCLLRAEHLVDKEWSAKYAFHKYRDNQNTKISLVFVESGLLPIAPGPDFPDLMKEAIRQNSVAGITALLDAGYSPLGLCGGMTHVQKASEEVRELLASRERLALEKIFNESSSA